jgi:repressor LexA
VFSPDKEQRMETLTRRQRQVLMYITRSLEERGYPPTMREIGEVMGIRSTNGVNDHLKALERKGYIRREDLKSRTLRLVGAETSTVAVPLLGRVAAGQPLLAVENIEETLRIDRHLVGAGDNVFALRVTGDSMIEAGVYDGDVIFVRRQETAPRGAMVVALVEDEATVKWYFPEAGGIRLQPANAALRPLFVPAQGGTRFSIVGVVVGTYRKL